MNIRGVVYLDVKIIGSQDELKESSLIDLYKESALKLILNERSPPICSNSYDSWDQLLKKSKPKDPQP